MQGKSSDVGRRAVASVGTAAGPRILAIDGPAGSGKSTVGYAVAQRLNYLFFDTGAMYRAVTWVAVARGVPIGDEAAVSELAQSVEIDILPPEPETGDSRSSVVVVDGEDITDSIRRPEVDRNVSAVSAYRRVREAMGLQQKRVGQRYGRGDAEKSGIVMVGRDIGTEIMPEAPLKIYLDASAEERAQRRYRELTRQSKEADYDRVLADIRRRDELDSGRELSPLRAADDAVVIDTSHMTIDEVVAAVLRLVQEQDESSE